MKGMIFTELLAMAEDAFGEEVVDQVIEAADLPSGGAYSRVGNYSCNELMTLIAGFSAHGAIPQPELQRMFGHWVMKSFSSHYPEAFRGRKTSFDMLESVENDVHVDVRKLYPDAELPSFETRREGGDTLLMTYRSPRPLADFCHGMIEACTAHFGETARIERQDRDGGGQTVAEFRIQTAVDM